MLQVMSRAQFGERRYGQLKSNLANRLNVISAPAFVAEPAEAAFDDHSLRAASTGAAPADA
jgi:hypothetical protein